MSRVKAQANIVKPIYNVGKRYWKGIRFSTRGLRLSRAFCENSLILRAFRGCLSSLRKAGDRLPVKLTANTTVPKQRVES